MNKYTEQKHKSELNTAGLWLLDINKAYFIYHIKEKKIKRIILNAKLPFFPP